MQGPSTKSIGVNTIKQKLLRPALTSHFRCYFAPPSAAKGFFNARNILYTGEDQEIIELSCSEASLPGSSIATHELNNDFTGVTERHAYRRLYDDRVDFSFYVNRDYTSIRFFETWISYIVGENDFDRQKKPEYSYRMNYPVNYITQALFITKFEKDTNPYQRKGINSNAKIEQDNKTLEYQFINAFPISITSMPVSYDAAQLLKCTVSFTYSRYVVKTLASKPQGEPGVPDTAAGTPNPFNPTPEQLAEVNSNFGFNSNIALSQSNISPGTVFDAGRNDPTRVFQNAELDNIGSNFRLF